MVCMFLPATKHALNKGIYLKILVLNYEYPPVGGGGGAVAQQVATRLASRGHEVGVQTVAWKDLPKSETSRGVTIRRHFAFRRRKDRCSVWEMMLFVVLGIIPTWIRIRKERPQVMHVHFAIPTGILAWILNKLTGVPYVITAHLGDVPGGVPDQTDQWFRWIHPIANRIWNNATAATAVSEFVRHLAEASYRVPVKTLRNGVVLPPKESLTTAPSSPPRLIFAGRFNPQKNLVFLIKVLAKLKSIPWECRLLGDGPEMEAVKHAITQHDLEQRVVLMGWVDSEQVDEALGCSDILLLPSHSEGLPVVSAKALAFGIAIVGSHIGGLKDVVTHEFNGLLLNHNSEDVFAQALGELLQDPTRIESMKKASREHARQFNLVQIINGYEKLFQAVTARK